MPHICRRARRGDIEKARHLWSQDEALYDPDIWSQLPTLLEGLRERDLATFCIVEAVPERIPRMLGGVSFVRPDCIVQARSEHSSLPNLVFRRLLENRGPLLSPKEVAVANTGGTLNLMNFFGNVDTSLTYPDLANFYDIGFSGYRFFHAGYSFRAMWFDVCTDYQTQELQTQGMVIDRRLPLPGGKTATLFRLTREDAHANPYGRICGYMFAQKPTFYFTFPEQRLLEYALLEVSDEEVAEELHVTLDAIKKRWRSIYERVDATDPTLISGADTGAGRRRTLLRYLRQNLVELRPYQRL